MKIILINILALLPFSNPIYSQTRGATSIKVTFVDLNIETFFSVSCDYFDSAFSKKEYHFIKIKNTDDLILFGNAFKNFTRVNSKEKSIDVRGTIEYIFKGQILKYYFNLFGIFSDGMYNYKNVRLKNLLHQKFPQLEFNPFNP